MRQDGPSSRHFGNCESDQQATLAAMAADGIKLKGRQVALAALGHAEGARRDQRPAQSQLSTAPATPWQSRKPRRYDIGDIHRMSPGALAEYQPTSGGAEQDGPPSVLRSWIGDKLAEGRGAVCFKRILQPLPAARYCGKHDSNVRSPPRSCDPRWKHKWLHRGADARARFHARHARQIDPSRARDRRNRAHGCRQEGGQRAARQNHRCGPRGALVATVERYP